MIGANFQLAFAHLNLRWNPFGETGLEDVPDLAVVQVEQFVDRLRLPGFAVQFMGKSGRGKTAHLLALHQYFPQAPYLHFDENAKIPHIPHAPLLFLDETQRLPRSLRKRVFARKESYAIGTHYDHSKELKKAGLEYQSVCLKGLTPTQLEQILRRRIEWARRSPGPVPEISPAKVVQLIEEYDDDVRSILDRLYEEFQNLKEVTNVS